MKPILLAAALIFVASAKLQATEALHFQEGGYTILVYIGLMDGPVVGQVRFTAPGAKDSVVLPRELVRVEKLDWGKRLILHFANKENDPALPGSFSLSIKKENTVLSIGGKKIKSTIDWDI